MNHRAFVAVMLAAVLLAACGAPAAETPAPSAAPSTAPSAEVTPEAAAFPVTIEHKYGRTEIPQQPTRVVSVGFNDQDAILALGVVPVGIRDWYGDQPNATWPWAQDKLGGATPAVLPANALNFEQIASLNPDLIIGISSGMTEEEYATLSQIAPTVAQSAEYVDYGVPWQEQTRVIGTALGRSQQAETLVAEVEALFADARAQNPAFNGASGLVAASFNNEYSAYGPQDARARLLESLGFATPDEITSLAGESFFVSISRERLDLLDTDVLVWVISTDAERQAIENDALYQQLDVARQQRAVFLDQELSGAASFSSVLSLPFLLDRLVPQLAAALEGGSSATPEATDEAQTSSATALQVLEETAEYRRVKHALGTTDVPPDPQRVVVINQYSPLDALLALNITVVGATGDPAADFPFAAWQQGRTDGIELIGSAAEPNLEKIVALKPDLILGPSYINEMYDQLSQIAPTVALPLEFRSSRDDLRMVADVVNRRADAEQVIRQFDARLAEFRAAMGPRLDQIDVSVARVFPDRFMIEGESYVTTLLEEAGLRRPTAQQISETQELSLEQVAALDGDVIFLYSAANAALEQDNRAARDELLQNPLFQSLRAVKTDRVYVVDSFVWAGGGILWANRVLDDLFTYLAEEPQP